MNAVSQLLRILAIVGALAAGALFYMSSKSGSTQQAAADTTLSTQLADAQAKVAAAQADVAKNAQALADATANAALADKARGDALNALDDATKKEKDAESASADKDTQIADLTTKAASVDDLTKQVADLKDQLAKAQTAPADQTAATNGTGTENGKATAPVVNTPPPVQLTAAAPAKVTKIDTKNWFIELNVGTDAGIQKDSILQLKVGNSDLGSVQVRDSKDGFSIGAITSTGGISLDDYSKIVKKDLNVQFQREM